MIGTIEAGEVFEQTVNGCKYPISDLVPIHENLNFNKAVATVLNNREYS